MDVLMGFRFGPMQKYLMPKSRETYFEPKIASLLDTSEVLHSLICTAAKST